MESRIIELENLIKKYATSYYSGESEVSDEYFDGLVEELRELNPESEVLSKTGWGFSLKEGRKVNHLYNLHVGSLSKVKSCEDIPYIGCRVSAKLDGLSVVSYYENGKRILALTRGNGTTGLDVTDKMHVIDPNSDDLGNNFTGAIRGEVLIDNTTWNQIKERFLDNPSANQRNFASGVLNRKEVTEDCKLLRYVVYKVIAKAKHKLGTLGELVVFLNNENLDTVPYDYHQGKLTESDLRTYFESFCKVFPCDGLVLTNKLTDEPGEVIGYEEIAYKFQAESVEVVVTDVTYTATRTGRMAPRVWFNPVELSGAMVEKATGFNAAFIRDNKINKGSVIEVCRSGEVIPHIMKVVKSSEEGLVPEICPSCGTPLEWSGVDLVCENENESQLAYRFVTTVAPVEGCGWSLYSKLLEAFNIDTFESLKSFLINLRKDFDSMKKIVDEKISGSATKSRCCKILEKLVGNIDPVTFLVACNIKGISWTSAETLMQSYPQFISDILKFNLDIVKLTKISGFGWSTVTALQGNENRIRELASLVNILNYEEDKKPEVLFKVAITGSLSVKRSEFDAKLSELGIQQSSNFNEIKYLITNNPNSSSSKMQKARKNNIKIISEEEFTRKYLKEIADET